MTSIAPTSVVEVAPGIHRIETPLGERYASLYLLVGDDAVLLYDTGVDGTIPAHVLPALDRLGISPLDVATVVVSHCDVDHFGGVADARAVFPRANIVAGAGDLPLIEDYDLYLSERARGFLEVYGWDEDPEVLEWCRSVTRETPLDGAASDGDIVPLGGGRDAVIRVVPGHSAGHLAVEAPWADAVLVGDAVLGASVDLADGTPAFPPTYRFVDDYLLTIQRLQAWDRDLLLTAHYPVMEGDATRAFLVCSAEFAAHLEELVIAELASTSEGLTLAELLARLNPTAGAWPAEGTEGALAFPVAGHLERLVDLRRVETRGERDGVAVWTLR
jgi:glyoxylase-like metal-dependent hydrolase (beta-lactamase superfamily II)